MTSISTKKTRARDNHFKEEDMCNKQLKEEDMCNKHFKEESMRHNHFKDESMHDIGIAKKKTCAK